MPQESGNQHYRLVRLEEEMKEFKEDFYGKFERINDRVAESSNKITALLMINGLVLSLLMFLLYKTSNTTH